MPAELVNDTTLYYEREGSGDPLVLIVGYSCDLGQWSAVRPLLASEFSLLLIDNRGVGRSECPDGPYSVRLMANDVAALMDRLNVRKAHVLGHSMGGAIAQELARSRPELVDRLVLANSLIKFPAHSAVAFRWLLQLREAGLPLRVLIEGALPWVNSRRFLADPENVRAAIEGGLANPFPQSLAGQRRQLEALLEFDSGPWFRQIAARTLVVAGEGDICTGMGESERLAEGIAGARLVRIPEMGHVPLQEIPGEFARLVREFLREA
jgi:pimeloyl-ACP methyl ester carboxylesterase